MSVEQIRKAINELGFWDLVKVAIYDDALLFTKFWYVWLGVIAVIAVIIVLTTWGVEVTHHEV